jgi:hypothetical protein
MSHWMALPCSSETRCRSCGRFEAARLERSVRLESRLPSAYPNRMSVTREIRMSVTREIRHRLRAGQPEPRFEPRLSLPAQQPPAALAGSRDQARRVPHPGTQRRPQPAVGDSQRLRLRRRSARGRVTEFSEGMPSPRRYCPPRHSLIRASSPRALSISRSIG